VDAVRIDDQAFTERAQKFALPIEHENWRIGTLAQVKILLGIDCSLAQDPWRHPGRKLEKWPHHRITPVAEDNKSRFVAHE
jgi:hypothetical protein